MLLGNQNNDTTMTTIHNRVCISNGSTLVDTQASSASLQPQICFISFAGHRQLSIFIQTHLSLAIFSMSFCLLLSGFMADTGETVYLTDPGTGRNRLTDCLVVVVLFFWYDPVLRAIMSSFSRSGTGSFSPYSSSSSSHSCAIALTTGVSWCGWVGSIGTLACCWSTLWEKPLRLKN